MPGSSTAQQSAQPAPRRRGPWGVVALVGVSLAAVTLAASFATDSSAFCGTCHEMRPYVTAWYTGRHHGHAECVDCHVQPGALARLAHKPAVLPEVWGHFFGRPRFPLPMPTAVPDSRCLRCHPAVPDQIPSHFSHASHFGKAACAECHPATGHDVSFASLGSEGVLATPPPTLTPAAGGHAAVSCGRCHDMRTRCEACHAAPHADQGACAKCHQLGARWAFAHPVGRDCQACHKPPPGHFGRPCDACHTIQVPFAKTRFMHPLIGGEHTWQAFPCAKCHPGSLATVSCTCHGGGRNVPD